MNKILERKSLRNSGIKMCIDIHVETDVSKAFGTATIGIKIRRIAYMRRIKTEIIQSCNAIVPLSVFSQKTIKKSGISSFIEFSEPLL